MGVETEGKDPNANKSVCTRLSIVFCIEMLLFPTLRLRFLKFYILVELFGKLSRQVCQHMYWQICITDGDAIIIEFEIDIAILTRNQTELKLKSHTVTKQFLKSVLFSLCTQSVCRSFF